MSASGSGAAHRIALVAGFAALPLVAIVMDRLAARWTVAPPAVETVRDPSAPGDAAPAALLALDAIRTGARPVPRRFVARLPEGLDTDLPADRRKALFLRSVLPLVLRSNERILADRARAEALLARLRSGQSLGKADRKWLAALRERYGLPPEPVPGNDGLLARVDAIPPSLALAQAALESGWGGSRFAQQGHALFGQRTWSTGGGLVPEARGARQTFEVKAFETPQQSVRAYMLNLNRHEAYADLRRRRLAARKEGRRASGSELAAGLLRYSEIGEAYVRKLRALIRSNRLEDFDRVRLSAKG